MIEKTLNLHCSYRDRDSVIYDFGESNSVKKGNFDIEIKRIRDLGTHPESFLVLMASAIAA